MASVGENRIYDEGGRTRQSLNKSTVYWISTEKASDGLLKKKIKKNKKLTPMYIKTVERLVVPYNNKHQSMAR